MTRASTVGVRLAACVLPLLGSLSAIAQDEAAFDRTPRDCILTSSIDDIDAIDDQNIIFRMKRNDVVYRNHLPRKCPGLERENRIAYETRGSRLCNIDTITVLEQFGAGLQRGFTCRLGEFVPLSPAEVEDLEFDEEGRSTQDVIETESVELEPTDENGEAAPAGAASSDEANEPQESSN